MRDDVTDIREDDSDASRERRRLDLDASADEEARGDWRGQGWRGGDREDPRNRGTPFLAFAVVMLLAVMVTVALLFVLRQQEVRELAPGLPNVQIDRPSLPTPGPAR